MKSFKEFVNEAFKLDVGVELRDSKNKKIGKITDFDTEGSDVIVQIDGDFEIKMNKKQIERVHDLRNGEDYYRTSVNRTH